MLHGETNRLQAICQGAAGEREERTAFAYVWCMLERLLLVTVIGATCVPATACDTSEAASSLPAPARRDAGLADAGPSADAHISDAGVDAGMPDAAVRRRRPPLDAGVDAGISDAGVSDAAVIDAPIADAGLTDAATIDAPPLSDAAAADAPPADGGHDYLRDSGEAPGLYDARILM